MDYKRHYDKLIERARDRKLKGYVEEHHIFPQCMIGPQHPLHLVNLTPEEHFIAHLLLIRIYSRYVKLIQAANLMSCMELRYGDSKNRRYGWLKRAFSKAQSESLSGENHYMFGKHLPLETIEKISEAQRGDKNQFFGKHHTDETKQKIGKYPRGPRGPYKKYSKPNRPQEKLTCPHCGFTGSARNMRVYHFENCREYSSHTVYMRGYRKS